MVTQVWFRSVLQDYLAAWTPDWTKGSVHALAWTLDWTSVRFAKVQVQTLVQDQTVASLLSVDVFCGCVWCGGAYCYMLVRMKSETVSSISILLPCHWIDCTRLNILFHIHLWPHNFIKLFVHAHCIGFFCRIWKINKHFNNGPI